MFVNKLLPYTLIKLGFELTMITVLITVVVSTARDQRYAISVDVDSLK